MLLGVLAQLVGPSLSAGIDGVSYFARFKVNDLYAAGLCCGGRGGGTRVILGGVTTQNAIGCPDFFVVIRRDHAIRTRRIGTGLERRRTSPLQAD